MAAASPLAQCSYMSECLDRELEAPVEGWLYLWLAFEDGLEKVYGLVVFYARWSFQLYFQLDRLMPGGAIRFCPLGP